ncbi:hypothetical protein [Aestuariicoccus sp. MJ-SS9]|uniref:hypothetical protein n=1 Tax=Aestuariicoccus sp. MJ-SS9 TaxID=3079855 RepID=UPI00290EF3E0|nr:hypothetical protein [Aestuariicoccus sp. MJ-SS9]MDU8909672.1 hypothetical protein [Aestuariicoccus sp. MJ-SS9]
MALTISLTSIPPRFGGLGPALECLLAQGWDRVVLALPRTYRRFPGPVTPPPLPAGVTLLWATRDYGPATKLLTVAKDAATGDMILYCDDDCLYAPGWARALQDVHTPGTVTCASSFPLSRLKRRGGRIAQGFGGDLVQAGALDEAAFKVPDAAFRVDDLWLSATYERQGFDVRDCPSARACVTPLRAPAPLQDTQRAADMSAAARHIHQVFGIWPPAR